MRNTGNLGVQPSVLNKPRTSRYSIENGVEELRGVLAETGLVIESIKGVLHGTPDAKMHSGAPIDDGLDNAVAVALGTAHENLGALLDIRRTLTSTFDDGDDDGE